MGFVSDREDRKGESRTNLDSFWIQLNGRVPQEDGMNDGSEESETGGNEEIEVVGWVDGRMGEDGVEFGGREGLDRVADESEGRRWRRRLLWGFFDRLKL